MAARAAADKKKLSGSRDSSSIKNLDREYFKNYRAWRKKNTFGYYVDDSNDELTYQDGIGFVRLYPEAHERSVLIRATSVSMGILILYTLIILAGDMLAPLLMKNVDIHFGSDYFRQLIRGEEWASLLLTFLVSAVSRLVPLIIIIKGVKMPPSVMLPVKVKNRQMLYMAALPAALINTCICFVLNQFYLHFLAKTAINTTIIHELPENRTAAVLTILVEVVIMPTLGEILVSGAAMQLFRQFGDGFAIVVTSLITAMECFDIRMVPSIFVNSLIIGYFTLRTGSVMTAILMRITVRASSVALVYLSDTASEDFSRMKLAVFIAAVLIVSMVLISAFQMKTNDKMNIDIKSTYLSEYEKAMCFLTCPMTLLWLSICVVVTFSTVPIVLTV